MVSVTVNTADFTNALQRYAAMSKKALGDAVKEQAKLLAKRLQDLTYPKTASQGKKRVAIDIGKVYLQNQWFENTFNFTHLKLGDRIKKLVRKGDVTALEQVFMNSQRLNKIHVEQYDKARHNAARKKGRVTYKQPYSFPIAQQGNVKALVNEKKAKVGFAKSGWAACYGALGGSVPGWLSRATGHVADNSQAQQDPSITLTNDVRYFGAINDSSNIVGRALEGRARDMITAAQKALQRGKTGAGIHP